MRMGVHKETLGPSLDEADLIFVYEPPDLDWSLQTAITSLGERVHVHHSIESIINDVMCATRPNDHILIMSNGAFGGIHGRLIDALEGLYG